MLRTPPPLALNTYFLIVTNFEEDLAPVLMRLKVMSQHGTARFLLAFNGIAVPDNGAVPILEPIHVGTTGTMVEREFQPQGLPINGPGLVLVASSTADTLTKDVSVAWNIEADVEEWETRNPDASVSGDITTDRDTLQVWSEASGASDAKKLLKVQIINTVASVRYMVVYAVDTPTADDKIIAWRPVPASARKEFCFGEFSGLSPSQQTPITGAIRQGCTIACQDDLTPGNVGTGTDFKIRAYYQT